MSLTIRRYKEEDHNTLEYKINHIVEGVDAIKAAKWEFHHDFLKKK